MRTEFVNSIFKKYSKFVEKIANYIMNVK
jgi:hypothetical protein